MKHPTAPRELIEAIDAGDMAAVARRVEAAPELVRARADDDVSVLLYAAYRGENGIAELLAARVGDLDLPEAVALGRRETARRLLEANAEAVHARSPDGFTSLHYAAFFGRGKLLKQLLEAGADVNAVADNRTRVCPLHSAAARGDADLCARLLEAGADPDARQAGGFTALMSAALHGNREMVERLLEAGADRTLRSDDDRSAADFAREGEHDALADALESA